MERLLNDDIVRQVKEAFDEQLQRPVEILFFRQKTGCDYCDDTRQLIGELAAISDILHVSIYDLDEDKAIASQYHVDKTPALVIAGREDDRIIDYGIRLAGIPSGHEFNSLIQDLILVSGRDSGLSQPTRDFLKNLTEPVHLQVFVTPT
jgi:glutaredoxin-like protein